MQFDKIAAEIRQIASEKGIDLSKIKIKYRETELTAKRIKYNIN